MAAKRNRIAAALAYVDEKAKRLTSLDQPAESDAVDMALEMGGSFIPGVGQALAARDFERARRADDEAGMAMAAASALPVGRLIGALKGFDPVMREIDVYHGSPHRFDEFDASKIGTGEGAQAYGHGIYLAESPNVAKGYQKQLAQIKPEMTVEFGLPITEKSKKFAETALQSSSGDADSAIKNLRENLQFYSSVEAKNAATEAINALKTAKITWGKDYPIGHFYTADLPDEMVDRMLDYDKPLKDQPAAYQAIRSTIPADVVKDFDANVEKGITGGNAYSNWVWGGKTPAGRSEKLRQSGIVGIKYADAGSRDQGGGTRNFVVFPGEEKKVKILKRE
jgi:hypothetical protein